MDTDKKPNLTQRPAVIMLIVFSCIFVNFAGKHLAVKYDLPLWLDSFGTVFAAYVLGPFSGGIVGFTGNLIYCFWDSVSLVYGITGIFIGLSLGFAARKKYFESFFGATSVAGWVTIGSVFISTVINIICNGGYTGNTWGDGVIDYLTLKGSPNILASFFGEMYLDFLDKLVTVLAMYYLVKFIRFFKPGGYANYLYHKNQKKNRNSKNIKKSGSAGLIIILLCAGMLAPSMEVKAVPQDDITYIQRMYNADNGLVCGHANDIVQTNDGILWVGSYSGLYRYNGNTFRPMNEFSNVKNVNCLYVDEEGRLWIGTNDSGVVIAIDGKEVNVLDSTNGLPSDSVRTIIQSSNGEYYIGTSDHMCVVYLQNGIRVSKDITEINYAQSITADRNGNVAAVTAEGKIYVLRDEEIKFSFSGENEGIRFSSCTFDPAGKLYAGTTDGKVIIYDLTDAGLVQERVIHCNGMTEINEVVFLDDTTWILADNGIGKIKGYVFARVSSGDFNSSVERMCVDYQGNLWFASTRHGLLQLSESSFSDLFTNYGLDPAVVNTTAVRNGILYVGTDSGIVAVRLSSGDPIKGELIDLLKGVRVRCIMNDSEDNLWICSYGMGLIKVSEYGVIKVFDTDNYDIGKRARACIELSDGRIAVSADAGYVIVDKNDNVKIIPYGEELGSSQILSICEAGDGKVYLGTDGNGIVVVENDRITEVISKADGLGSGVVLRMVYDEYTDSIFIVTSNSICVMKNGELRRVTRFPYSNNYDIVLDDDGEAFVLGSAGIYVVKKSDLISDSRDMDYLLLNSRMGLRGALTANSWNELTDNGDLYLSTDRGAVMVNLDAYRPERRTYRIMVSEVRLDGVPVSVERGNRLTVGTDVNTIEFIPEIVNYTLDDPKVSFYLEGIDSSYKTLAQSELSGALYTNLPAGEYRFHIAIIDEETGNILEESIYGFVKEKSIYDNNWFIFYMLLVGGLFVGWFTWFLTRYSSQKKIDIQQERLSLALKQVQMGNETIMAIAKTVDAKDTLTSQHSQRVSEYSVLIARNIGFSEEEIENLRNAALLHDIGKIGIPDRILNKPASLTDEEYEIMKSHVTKGADILREFTLVKHAAEGAKYHHERYDGTGYPDGLKGKDIPLYGRIIAIADAFDAMTANRIYRMRMPFSKVMDELHRGRGTQFDPELLDVLLQLIENGDIDTVSLYADIGEEGTHEV